MDPTSSLRAIARRRLLVIACVIVVAAIAGASGLVDTAGGSEASSYQATTTLLGHELKDTVAGNLQTAAFIVKLDPVAERAAATLGYEADPAGLAAAVQAETQKNSSILQITATGPDATTAVARADAFADALIDYLKVRTTGALVVLERGRVHPAPDPATIGIPQGSAARAGLGAIVGLFLGIALALALARFDTRLRSAGSMSGAAELPILGEVPPLTRDQRKGVASARDPLSSAATAFRILAAGITARVGPAAGSGNGSGPPGFVILVTSVGPAEGKTTVAANLGVMFAEASRSVLLISCDLRRPALHECFGASSQPGLVELLDPDEPWDGSLTSARQHVGIKRLALIASGTHDRPGELLASDDMRRLLEGARAVADVVILDAPALLEASDALPLIGLVNTVVVVARSGRVRSEGMVRMGDLLRRLRAPLPCVVVNGESEQAVTKPSFADELMRVP